jgi:hypothetical protein
VKEAILVKVHESLSLLLVCRRETICIGLIVLEFRVDKIVNLEHSKCTSERCFTNPV